jgi:putative tryptophan/tyrosine transport system substrate-binding protein
MTIRRRDFITLLGGAAAVWPLAARAQQPGVPVIGFLNPESVEAAEGYLAAFRKGLGDAGYTVGRNVAIEYRFAEHHYDRLPALASELVRRQVAVIATGPRGALVAAKAATSTIPIVFMSGADPVRRGIVASLNRPGGNLTGVTLLANDLSGKRLGLLHDLVPNASIVGTLSDATGPEPEFPLELLRAAAGRVGVTIRAERVAAAGDFDQAFANLVRDGAGALIVVSGAFFGAQRERIAALAARHAIPAMYTVREFVDVGGLVSYGPSAADAYRQMGVYAGRILKGEKPTDLPVLLPTKFELVINLRTAKALGLEVPAGLSAIADEVIE